MGLRLPAMAYALLFAILQISAIVPLPTSPGRLGVFHYLCVLVLALWRRRARCRARLRDGACTSSCTCPRPGAPLPVVGEPSGYALGRVPLHRT